MSTFVQRQISAFCGDGSLPDPVNYGVADRTWSSQDVYPSKILMLPDGIQEADEISVAANGGTATLALPANYDPALRLFVVIRSTQTITCHVVSPDHPDSTTVLRAGATAGMDGLLSFTGTVTSIDVTNNQTTAATVEYFMFEYPPDLGSPDAWRDGTQTTGIGIT